MVTMKYLLSVLSREVMGRKIRKMWVTLPVALKLDDNYSQARVCSLKFFKAAC